MTMPITPMTVPRFSRGVISKARVHTMGMATPLAIACSTRASRSNPKLGATAAKAEAAANSTNPPANNRRTGNRPNRKAFSGITTASTIA